VAALAGGSATRPREEEPVGVFKRRASELGARWRRKSGEGAAGGRGKCWQWAVGGAAEKQRGEVGGRRRGPVCKFCKSSRSLL
jgi:hypothetical protein